MNWNQGGFVFSSGILCTFFGNPSGAPEGLRTDSRRIPEENIKKVRTRYGQFINSGQISAKIYLTEPLYTLCNFPVIAPHFCRINHT